MYEMPKFTSKQWLRIKGRGWMANVECDQERPRDDSGLLGLLVNINGEVFRVLAVERHMPGRPIAKGELIGLLVADETTPPTIQPVIRRAFVPR